MTFEERVVETLRNAEQPLPIADIARILFLGDTSNKCKYHVWEALQKLARKGAVRRVESKMFGAVWEVSSEKECLL